MSFSNNESFNKRRVLLVVRWPVGGIRTFLKYTIGKIPTSEFDFSFVGVDTSATGLLKEDLSGVVSQWHIIPADGNEYRRCFKYIYDLLRSEKFDVLHVHGFTSLMASVVPALIFKVPIVFTSHDVLMINQFKGWMGGLKKAVLSLALNQCTVVHSVSKDAHNNLREMVPFLNTEKQVVLLNGINSHHFMLASKRNLKSELGLLEDQVLIGFFGRFMNQKGFRFLIDALKILNKNNGDRFHVACFGAGAYIREEKSKISELGFGSSFTFFDFTPDISSSMKGCDLIVMPSLWEACPLQPMEALCAGVPFVGSDCVGLREVLDGTPAIQVKAGDANSLSDGILKCIKIGKVPFTNYAPVAVERFDVIKSAIGLRGLYVRAIL